MEVSWRSKFNASLLKIVKVAAWLPTGRGETGRGENLLPKERSLKRSEDSPSGVAPDAREVRCEKTSRQVARFPVSILFPSIEVPLATYSFAEETDSATRPPVDLSDPSSSVMFLGALSLRMRESSSAKSTSRHQCN